LLTTIEKVIALQDVDIFSQVSTEELGYLAAIAVEETHPQGAVIYQARDPADSMYQVIEGRVRLHRGDLDINVAGTGEPFGTWALFDDEVRVTAATVLDEARVLRVGKEDFIDLLADNVEITQGVLKALVGRVRGLIGTLGAR
jgi:CRP-like cAMP-binding protein